MHITRAIHLPGRMPRGTGMRACKYRNALTHQAAIADLYISRIIKLANAHLPSLGYIVAQYARDPYIRAILDILATRRFTLYMRAPTWHLTISTETPRCIFEQQFEYKLGYYRGAHRLIHLLCSEHATQVDGYAVRRDCRAALNLARVGFVKAMNGGRSRLHCGDDVRAHVEIHDAPPLLPLLGSGATRSVQ